MSRNIIYTFSGNQLPAIDNKKTLKNDKVCRGWGGGGGGGVDNRGHTTEICKR